MVGTSSPLPLRSMLQADPVLRRLLTITFVETLGRGAFYTLPTLYLTLIVGLPVVTVGLGLTIAGGVGVVSSALFGHLADRVSSRRMMIVLYVLQGAAFIGYLFVHDLLTLALFASGVAVAQRGGGSVRSAVIGRAFGGEDRVRIRALMRTVTNIGIGMGAALAAIPLAIGTELAFEVTIVFAGVLFVCSALLVVALPAARVDAPPKASVGPQSDTAAGRPERGGPYRDVRYLALTACMGVFGMQFGLFEVGLPLWVTTRTIAPAALVSSLLLLNTVVVILLQVRLSRGTGTFAGAGRAMLIAGGLMVLACGLYAAAGGIEGSGWLPVAFAIVVLLAGALAHTFAEITSSAAGWGLSFDLAPPERVGSYQGVYGTGFAIGAMVAPLVITLTAINLGALGWGILATLFAAAAGGVVFIARKAARDSRQSSSTPST